nr:PREDICTED: uncharacterized protein LOC105677623 [Linepithema humile]
MRIQWQLRSYLMLTSGFFYLIKPVIVTLLEDDDVAVMISGTSKLPFHVEYEKLDQHICSIMIHCYYYSLRQHVYALLDTLENIDKDSDVNFFLKLNKIEDNNCSIALSCLRKHLNVLEFAKLIESTLRVFLISVNFNMIISLCGIHILMSLEGSAKDIAGPVTIYLAQLFHLFLHFWQAQFLLDYSAFFCESVCRANWYYTSRRCQKLFLLIMNRMTLPCTMTAGKLMTLSIENFGMVNKTVIIFNFFYRYNYCLLR